MKKELRSGYTTGACAAAATKAAVALLFDKADTKVEIPFPDGQRVSFTVLSQSFVGGKQQRARASIIKDAGDDPDVTNGAEIIATVNLVAQNDLPKNSITFQAGPGVGTVTRPGLAIPVGEPAINPVPRKMIAAAIDDALANEQHGYIFEVEISVANGENLASKTLNGRLGIVGGISILGSTGIVRPVSAKAWTATITTSMRVAKAGGHDEIVLSTGRTSEKALAAVKNFAPETMIVMGDYLEFALQEAGKFHFSRLHLAGMWAKTIKAAMHIPQTHVRFGALEINQALDFLGDLFPKKDFSYLAGVNTAREIYQRLHNKNEQDVIKGVCQKAHQYQQQISGLPVTTYLIHHDKTIVAVIE